MPTTTTTSQEPSHQQKQQRIPNPRRLLILSPSSHSPTTIPPFLHALTGTPVLEAPSTSTTTSTATSSAPSNEATTTTTTTQPSFAGYTTHPPLQIRNRYYVAEVPVWVDEIALEGTATSTVTVTSTSSSTSTAEPGSGPDADVQSQSENKSKEEQEQEPEPITTPSLWKKEFSGPEAQVVRDAIGAVVLCIVNPTSNSISTSTSSSSESKTEIAPETQTHVDRLKEFLRAVGDVRALVEEERGGMGDVPGLVVLVGGGEGTQAATAQQQKKKQDLGSGQESGMGDLSGDLGADLDLDTDAEEPFSVPWWEDQLYEMGLIGMEVVNWDPKAGGEETEERNQFGEYQGLRRIREVLETHDWAPSSLSDDEDKDGDDEADEIEKMLLGADADEDEDTGFGLEVNELEREMVGLRFAIERGGGSGRADEDSQDEGDDELRVDAVEALMLRMAAIRDMSDELPEHERKRFAAKAVRDIMKEI
ncbi:adaptin-binding domain-containing protein [Aspergillus affinis]|uniref:adaptin-binding domain-containing protein n=1 Tax=Aspergillus affinis TaxID=1070780 RepID=UPI0022FEE440|nr:uncharacterized protein KD926_003419 [Aspergillus affinis]KAI9035521.1 hypothetical protein KD926_003419 [Aspergillus affinis]